MTAPAAPAPVTEATPEATPAATPSAAPTPAAAPAEAPAAAPVSQTPPEARRPLSRREAKAEAMQREGLAPEAETAAAPEPGASAAAPAEGAPGEGAAAPAPTPPEAPAPPRPILVPLPPALREMGVETLTATTPQEERAVRALVNGYVRRQELATAQARASELERRLAEKEAREAAVQKWEASPERKDAQERYQKLVELETAGEVPAGTAEQFRASYDAQVARIAQAERDQRMAAIEEQEAVSEGRAFQQQAWMNALTIPAPIRALPKFEQWFNEAIETFDAKIERGHYDAVLTQPDKDQRLAEAHRLFMKEFGASLQARADVMGIYRTVREQDEARKSAAANKAAEEQRRLDKIKADTIEEYKRGLAAQRQTTPPHPLGSLAAPARPARGVATGSEAAAAPAAPQSPQSPRKLAKAAAMDRVREQLGT